MRVLVKCPYCGCNNSFEREKTFQKTEVVLNCYSDDEQSCDRYFAVFSKVEIQTKTYKIEVA